MIHWIAFLIGISDPTSGHNVLQDGLLAMRAGRYAEAKTDLERATQLEPGNAIAWISLAETCRRTNDTVEAGDAARHAAEKGAEMPAVQHALAMFYAAAGSFLQGAKWEEKYALSPEADAEAMARAGDLYLRAGTPPDAERAFKGAWQLHQSDPEISFQYAKLLLQRLDFDGAVDAVSAASKSHPEDPQLVLVAGVAKYGQRRFASGIDDFLKVISIDPTIPQPYLFLGKMLEQAGPELPEITKAFEARVKTAPDDALVNLVLAKAKLMTNPRDALAEALLQHSIAIDSGQWESHYELGVVLESKHEFKEAEEALTRSVALDPKQPMPHYHLARVYDRLSEPEKAQAERKIHSDLTSDQK